MLNYEPSGICRAINEILIDVRSDNVSAPQPSTGDIPSLGSLSERKGMLIFLGAFLGNLRSYDGN